jgi:hypothetical protein
MPVATDQIRCPRNPDHGLVTKRCLAPEEREMITRVNGDVFEIGCHVCGRYECEVPVYSEKVVK